MSNMRKQADDLGAEFVDENLIRWIFGKSPFLLR